MSSATQLSTPRYSDAGRAGSDARRVSRLAIVGAGPWGTYALERLAARAAELTQVGVTRVAVFEATGSFGDGRIHHAGQVATSPLNRVASQIGFAADESIPGAPLLPEDQRRTLAQWAISRHDRLGHPRYALDPNAIPTRALHGEALREAFNRYVAHLEAAGVVVDRIAGTVTAVDSGAGAMDDGSLLVRYETGGRSLSYRASAVLLTTGHGTGVPDPIGSDAGRDAGPYPLFTSVTEARVPAGCAVALSGAGLTAVDIILHLTEGRGGCFTGEGRLRYEPGGQEPARIIPLSPSGLLPAARPVNEKAVDATGRGHASLELRPRWFTIDTVEALAAARGDRLSFDDDVLPVIVLEMALTYYRAFVGDEHTEVLARGSDTLLSPRTLRSQDARTATARGTTMMFDAFTELWRKPEVRERVASVMAELPRPPWLSGIVDPDALRFDWDLAANPLSACGVAPMHWAAGALAHMRWDLACARQGNLSNPWKAAWDGVWRDLRPVLSRVLDFDLLSPESKARFLRTHWRIYSRQVNGSGPESVAKLVALAEGGILDLGAGPGAHVLPMTSAGSTVLRADGTMTPVDAVISARVPRLDPFTEAPYAQLLRHGHLTVLGERNDHPVLNLSRGFHPISRDGREDRRITVLGPPAEGRVLFQMALARPQSTSSVVRTVEAWAAELIELLTAARHP